MGVNTMIKLQVVPQDVLEMMQAEGIPLTIFHNINDVVQNLSVHDMADIHTATVGFPYTFDPVLDIRLVASPTVQMASDDECDENIRYRVEERIASRVFKNQAQAGLPTKYTLNPVDENLWVVVQQRLHGQASDPNLKESSTNQVFFESLIAQVLHILPFEKVCTTNLFSQYLLSLNARAA